MRAERNLYYAYQSLTMLFSATNKLQVRGDKHLGDMTIRQVLTILAILYAPNKNASVNQIARQLGTTKQSAAQIVDALRKKGCVSVAPSEKDKRSVSVTVTAAGEKVMRESSIRVNEFITDIFIDFTSEELASFHTLLKKLYHTVYIGDGRDFVASFLKQENLMLRDSYISGLVNEGKSFVQQLSDDNNNT